MKKNAVRKATILSPYGQILTPFDHRLKGFEDWNPGVMLSQLDPIPTVVNLPNGAVTRHCCVVTAPLKLPQFHSSPHEPLQFIQGGRGQNVEAAEQWIGRRRTIKWRLDWADDGRYKGGRYMRWRCSAIVLQLPSADGVRASGIATAVWEELRGVGQCE